MAPRQSALVLAHRAKIRRGRKFLAPFKCFPAPLCQATETEARFGAWTASYSGIVYLKGSAARDLLATVRKPWRSRCAGPGMKRKIAFETAKFGRREPCAQAIILAVAAAVVVVWVLTKPIVFTQDTITYINAARELRLGQSTGDIFSRLPAFPAVLAAFHITDLKHTVFWLIVFQACLAVGSCWLFYLTARLLSPRVGAFVVSLIFIASLLPFVQVKHIMTEQAFFFETMLTAFGMVAYLLARTMRGAWSSLAVLGVGTTLMTLTRPQGAYVVPVVFGLVGVLAWRRAALAIVGAIMVLGAVWSIQILDHRARSMSQMSAGSLDSSHMTGKMFFFALYLDGSSRANIRIAPGNGPKTAELKALLVDEYAKPDTLARRKGLPGRSSAGCACICRAYVQ